MSAGFIRVAAEEGASLVPVAVLGEASTLRNLIDMPWLQLWTYKRLGFPVPYLLVGRWGITPFPRQTCLRFVVGEPIPIPLHAQGPQVGHASQWCQMHMPSRPGVRDQCIALWD